MHDPLSVYTAQVNSGNDVCAVATESCTFAVYDTFIRRLLGSRFITAKICALIFKAAEVYRLSAGRGDYYLRNGPVVPQVPQY